MDMEQRIVQIRQRLEATRFEQIGAPRIKAELIGLGYASVPSLPTIERILCYHGYTQPRQRISQAPVCKVYPGPKAQDSNDVHAIDLIGPRYLKGDSTKYYYSVLKDLYDHALYVELTDNRRTDTLCQLLLQGWHRLGIPSYLQMDNGREFTGQGRWPRSLGQVIRLCLYLGVESVFVPEGMPCWQGSIENVNGWLGQHVIKAKTYKGTGPARRALRKSLEVANTKHVHQSLGWHTSAEYRREKPLVKLPADFQLPEGRLPICAGKITFIRWVRTSGRITILGEKWCVGKRQKHQYVKATIYTKSQELKLYYRGQIIKRWPYKIPL
jgi:transposase InsO family protein